MSYVDELFILETKIRKANEFLDELLRPYFMDSRTDPEAILSRLSENINGDLDVARYWLNVRGWCIAEIVSIREAIGFGEELMKNLLKGEGCCEL